MPFPKTFPLPLRCSQWSPPGLVYTKFLTPLPHQAVAFLPFQHGYPFLPRKPATPPPIAAVWDVPTPGFPFSRLPTVPGACPVCSVIKMFCNSGRYLFPKQRLLSLWEESVLHPSNSCCLCSTLCGFLFPSLLCQAYPEPAHPSPLSSLETPPLHKHEAVLLIIFNPLFPLAGAGTKCRYLCHALCPPPDPSCFPHLSFICILPGIRSYLFFLRRIFTRGPSNSFPRNTRAPATLSGFSAGEEWVLLR